ncbi:HAD family phosphatase [Algoriphagus sp. CAU 1675]|uniref:HAD family hydrolase n=1 Tax=Algoriphagus sp. CAU 1675 TaxID=3032597 RepID=UPI0023DA49CE|nr:HAD family phosphatase [Algoriphagus sp. CAU 1675]MDF2157308.1 HAD family phosphatase [Algoriphagus sp. CAU 1675]
MSLNHTYLNNVKALIFDMDGTLVDNIPYHLEAWLHFLSDHGIHLLPEEFHAQNHGTIDEMIARFFPHVMSEEKIIELGTEKEDIYRRIYKPHLKEVKGLSGFLETMKSKKLSLHLATMGDEVNINFTLEGLGILELFDSITGGHEVKHGKPHPEIFEKALKKSHVRPEECLVFEDSGGGIRAAKAAGLTVVGITTSHTKQELMEMGCDEVISDFDEAQKLFED